MKKLNLFMAVIIAGLFWFQSDLTARQNDRGPRGDRMGFSVHMAEKNLFPAHMLLKLKDQIQLSAEQLKKIEDLQTEMKQNSIKQKAEIELLQLQFDKLLGQNPVNRKEIDALVGKISNLRSQFQLLSLHHLLDLKELLTPQQLEQLEKIKSEFRQRHMKNFQEHMRDRKERKEKD